MEKTRHAASSASALSEQSPTLGIPGFDYADLYRPQRLAELSERFNDYLQAQDARLGAAYKSYKGCVGQDMSAETISELLVDLAPHLGAFVAQLFDIEATRHAQMQATKTEIDTFLVYKNEVVAKVTKQYKGQDVTEWDLERLEGELQHLLRAGFSRTMADPDPEAAVAYVAALLFHLNHHFNHPATDDQPRFADAEGEARRLRDTLSKDPSAQLALAKVLALESPADFAAGCCRSSRVGPMPRCMPAAGWSVAGWSSLKTPGKTDFNDLVEHQLTPRDGHQTWSAPASARRRRDGFALTDRRFNQRQVLYEVDHCIYCHDRDTDSCSKGMRNKRLAISRSILSV